MSQYLDPPRALNAGAISPGARLYFYESDTADKLPVWADYDRTVEHPNPLTADAAGRFPPIYYNQALEYRVLMVAANGAIIVDADPYTGSNLPGRTPLTPLDDDGSPLPLAQLTFWRRDTTQLEPIYQDGALQDEWPNPVTADADGLFQPIWLDETREYRVRLERADGTLVYDLDYQQVLSIFLTSRIYPIDVVEALLSGGDAITVPQYQFTEALENTGDLLSLELRALLQRYEDGASEALETSGDLLSIELRALLRTYEDAAPEALETSGEILSIEKLAVLQTYQMLDEALETHGELLSIQRT